MAATPLTIVGQTTDGKLVVGFFKMTDTHGVPLDVVLDHLRDRDFVPDWIGYYEDSLKGGQRPDRILLRMEIAIGDVYGTPYCQTWKTRMTEYLQIRDKYRTMAT